MNHHRHPEPRRRAFMLLAYSVLLIAYSVFLSSCASYKRCQDKFASRITDSVRVTVPVIVTVPPDSVVTSFVTDTTYLYKEIQQGRAKVVVERTNTITTVQAKCDTVTITKLTTVKLPGERVVWGVKPAYKNWFKIARALLALSILINIFQFLNRRLKQSEK